MKNRFKVTIEDKLYNTVESYEVDTVLMVGINNGRDFNKTQFTVANGSYINLCRGVTLLGAIVNGEFRKSIKEVVEEDNEKEKE